MQRAWKKAVAITFIGTVACAPLALADYAVPKYVKYEYNQDASADPAYTIARNAMDDFYKGTEYEKGAAGFTNASLDIGQIDLNGDQMPEILATPVESDIEYPPLCNPDKTCPFYIFEVRGKKVHKLGQINAYTIDRGDDVRDGYWTLTVYTQKADGTPVPHIYVYDRKKDGYVPEPSVSKAVLPTPITRP